MSLQTRPNILWVQTDQQRPDSIGCMGSAWAKTPNFDRLAARGVLFKNTFCQAPVCVPSRASQLTCRYPQEINTLSNIVAGHANIYPKGTKTFPEVFAEAGYDTINIGKSHTPDHPTWIRHEGISHQLEYASQSSLGDKYKNEDYRVLFGPSRSHGVIQGGTYPSEDGHQSRLITNSAIDYLKSRDSSKPFLLRVSHIWPHTPVLPPPPWDSIYQAKDLPITPYSAQAYEGRCGRDKNFADRQGWSGATVEEREQLWTDYMALVACIDNELGLLLRELESLGLTKDTLVMTSTDHGNSLGEWGAIGKLTFDDPVWRGPMIMSHPGHLPEGEVRDDLCESLDVGRTLLSHVGLEEKTPDSFCGRDLFNSENPEAVFSQVGLPHTYSPLLSRIGKAKEPSEEPTVFWRDIMRVAIRDEQYRLDVNWMRNGKQLYGSDLEGQLFDLKNDPQEIVNLFGRASHKEVQEKLLVLLQDWQNRIDKPKEIFTGMSR